MVVEVVDAEASLVVRGDCGLRDLTRRVEVFCDDIEVRSGASAGVIELVDAASGSEWPGRQVSIQDVNRWERALRRLERIDGLTLCAAQGHCGGPAFELMLIADYRLATPDLRLSLPFNAGAIWPGMSLFRLVQQVGLARARRLMLPGAPLDSEECVAAGLVDAVGGAPNEMLSAWLCAGVAPQEASMRRRLLLEACSTSFEDALGTHLAACDRDLRRLNP